MMFVTPSEKQTSTIASGVTERLPVCAERLGLWGPRVMTMYLKSTAPARLEGDDPYYVPHRFRHQPKGQR